MRLSGWISSFAVLFLGCICYAQKLPVSTAIKVDQVGYLASAPKTALVTGPHTAREFFIRRVKDDTQAFSGTLTAPREDHQTGDMVQTAEFTALTDTGDYYLEVPGIGSSWKFSIAPDVYARAYYLAMRAFYGQRCGTAVDLGPEFPAYKYGACHKNQLYHPTSGRQGPAGTSGGWHDAGDYGRYTVNSGITNGTLLWAFELFGAHLRDRRLNIPESGNGTPDILNETRWNVEWMLSMQDADGGAWHKETSEQFAPFISPDADTLPSYVIGTGTQPFKSTCATADLAAVGAIAARVYAPFDRKFADRNLQSARKAWQWTERNPNVTFRNPPGIATGEYGDSNCSDERLWAAAELWRTTGEAPYHRYFLAHYQDFLITIESAGPENWAQVAPMGLWTYALATRNGHSKPAVERIRKVTIDAADMIVRRSRENPYRISMRDTDFVWGSNSLVAGYGMELLIANIFSPQPNYKQTALENLHYLFGRNAFSLSFVTQLGDNAFRHPHHRPSVALGLAEPWPGLLSGGPNAKRQDDVLKSLPALPPARVYSDNKDSYASNEVAINWQAALVFVLAGSLQ
jgi:endoglucanase